MFGGFSLDGSRLVGGEFRFLIEIGSVIDWRDGSLDVVAVSLLDGVTHVGWCGLR